MPPGLVFCSTGRPGENQWHTSLIARFTVLGTVWPGKSNLLGTSGYVGPVSPIFTRDGEWFIPTEVARGPWDRGFTHGGPPAALLVRAIEATEGAEAFVVVRVSTELLRPVPMGRLRVETEVVRPGRRVRGIDASLFAEDGTKVSRATATCIRYASLPLPAGVEPHDTLAGPETVPAPEVGETGWDGFHNLGVDMRFLRGDFTGGGPATVWIRLREPLIEGETPTGAQIAAAVADFTNGVSSVLPFESWTFLNADLTVSLSRRPVGEWIAIDAQTIASNEGTGLGDAALYDQHGRLGRVTQSLLFDRR
jgi:hypothetical protein